MGEYVSYPVKLHTGEILLIMKQFDVLIMGVMQTMQVF